MVECGGGVARERVADGGIGVGQCTPLACPPEAAWDPVSCACQPIASATNPGSPGCSAQCPNGTVLEIVNGVCGCVALEPLDATLDVTEIDAPGVTDNDAYAYPWAPDASPCTTAYGGPCGPGSAGYTDPGATHGTCTCFKCPNSCPSGQIPVEGCGGCIACSTKCPQGFVYGTECSCVPIGTVQSAVPPGPDGGPTWCPYLEESSCPAGQWCPAGTCPDGQTQYGCYCDAQAHLTCQLACQMNWGGTCLLAGNFICDAGSFCEMGLCRDDSTPYGCICNADGTATTCDQCPPGLQLPCWIPGVGTCPGGSTCKYDTCDGGSGAITSCSCFDGTLSCSASVSCGAQGDGGLDGG